MSTSFIISQNKNLSQNQEQSELVEHLSGQERTKTLDGVNPTPDGGSTFVGMFEQVSQALFANNHKYTF